MVELERLSKEATLRKFANYANIKGMTGYKDYFKGKKITIMGLGLLGKGLGDARFLAECGAVLTVTDLKTKEQLASSILALKKYKNIRYVLGKHEMVDFENCDFILKAQGVPLASPYIDHARAHGVPIRMDDELFIECAPKSITTVGVTGTRGKTTTASLIYHIVKKSGEFTRRGGSVYLAGNIRGVATLELLKKIKAGDIVVLELSSWQLQGFHEAKISPHIAVFTNFMDDHMNYYPSRKEYFFDKSAIYKYQKKDDVCITGEQIAKKIPDRINAHFIARPESVPQSWKVSLAGTHNRENIAAAVAVTRALNVPLLDIKKGVESFKSVHGRLEVLRMYKGIKIYNDNSSSTPEATVAALSALGDIHKKNIVLVIGGKDKGLDVKPLVKAINKFVKKIIMLPGTGTDKNKKLWQSLNCDVINIQSLKNAVTEGLSCAQKGDTFLFSPSFSSIGMFTNVYDRNDQFVKIIKGLK